MTELVEDTKIICNNLTRSCLKRLADSFNMELEIEANEIQCQQMQNNAWRGKGNNPLFAAGGTTLLEVQWVVLCKCQYSVWWCSV